MPSKSSSVTVSMLTEVNILFFSIAGAERTQSGLGALQEPLGAISTTRDWF